MHFPATQYSDALHCQLHVWSYSPSVLSSTREIMNTKL